MYSQPDQEVDRFPVGTTGYTRRVGEYVRPPKTLRLSKFGPMMDTFVAGVPYHEAANRMKKRCTVELVPEPGNPHDSSAVAVDVSGERVGYLTMGTAEYWHDLIRALNDQGYSATTRAEKHRYGYDNSCVGIRLELPSYSSLDQIAETTGLTKQFSALTACLSDDELDSALDSAWMEVPLDVAEKLYQSRALAPGLRWASEELELEDRVPMFVQWKFRSMVLQRDELRAVQREEARRLAKKAREDERLRLAEEKKTARLTLTDRAVELNSSKCSLRMISEDLGVSQAIVRKLLKEAGDAPASSWNSDQAAERITKAEHALALQRSGSSRRAISQELSCSLEVVKDLLRDAKFYANPEADSQRLQFVVECGKLNKGGMSSTEIAQSKGINRLKVRAAIRDSKIIGPVIHDQT